MNIQTKAIISFYELDEVWQAEAVDNLGNYAKGNMYLEPDEESNPKEHILWDLSECMPYSGEHDGFKYNAVIGVSNNSAMLLRLNDACDEANYIIV